MTDESDAKANLQGAVSEACERIYSMFKVDPPKEEEVKEPESTAEFINAQADRVRQLNNILTDNQEDFGD